MLVYPIWTADPSWKDDMCWVRSKAKGIRFTLPPDSVYSSLKNRINSMLVVNLSITCIGAESYPSAIPTSLLVAASSSVEDLGE